MAKKRKVKKPDIPVTLKANITDTMRKEMNAEEFEKVSATSPAVSAQSSTSASNSEVSATQESTMSQGPRTTILKGREEIHDYQNDVLSAYDGTSGTVSFESLRTMSQSTLPSFLSRPVVSCPLPSLPLNGMRAVALPPVPLCPPPRLLTHKEFASGTRVKSKKLLPSAVVKPRFARGEAELYLINMLIADIQKLVRNSKRTELTVRAEVTWETSGLPSLHLVVVRRPDIPTMKICSDNDLPVIPLPGPRPLKLNVTANASYSRPFRWLTCAARYLKRCRSPTEDAG